MVIEDGGETEFRFYATPIPRAWFNSFLFWHREVVRCSLKARLKHPTGPASGPSDEVIPRSCYLLPPRSTLSPLPCTNAISFTVLLCFTTQPHVQSDGVSSELHQRGQEQASPR